MLGFVPPIVIAAKARTRDTAVWAVAFTLTFAVGFIMVGLQPEDTDNFLTRLGVALVFLSGIGGAAYGAIVGARLDWSGATGSAMPPPPAFLHPNDVAVAAVRASRQRRTDARALADRDPQMARELGIGRPDLPRQYDDGGLVDMNGVPAETMVMELGINQTDADRIVEVRTYLGRFTQPSDLVVSAGMEQADFDRVRERIILLPR